MVERRSQERVRGRRQPVEPRAPGHILAPQRLRTPGAAAYLGISPRTMESWRVRGGGPPFLKLGGTVLYDIEDLERYVAENRRHSTSDVGAQSPERPRGGGP